MSDVWTEFYRQVDHWRQAGDADRLKLADLYHEALRFRETEPEYQFELLTQARNEAQRLEEPWWILFYEYWRLSTLTADLHDFARAHPLAMELMVRFSSPEGRVHPERIGIYTCVLYTYLQVDPVGYRTALEQGFSSLDEQIAKGPVSNRFVLNYRWTEYLCQLQRWEEAYDRAQQFLALVDGSDPGSRIWWECWVFFLLCGICDALGRVDELGGHAKDMAERSEKSTELMRTKASGWIWLAVAQRARGDERAAARSFHQGMHYLKDVAARDEICADAIARFYELGSDWKSALGVRDRELAVITKKGMLHRCCLVQIERCRLLARLGALTPTDISEAQQAAAKMQVPRWYLEKLARIEK